MNWENWVKLGAEMKTLRATLMKGKNNDPRPRSKKPEWKTALTHLESARDLLDDAVFDTFPEKTTNELAYVFYGPLESASQ